MYTRVPVAPRMHAIRGDGRRVFSGDTNQTTSSHVHTHTAVHIAMSRDSFSSPRDQLCGWQRQVLGSGLDENRNERIVDCIVDPGGCVGKATVALLGTRKHGHIDMTTVHDGKLLATLHDILSTQQNRTPRVIYLDMTRTRSNDNLCVLFTAIKQMKDGRAYDLRYSYKCWWFDSPRVWVFMNEFPDTRYLSADRWRFWRIVGGNLVEAHAPAHAEAEAAPTSATDGR